MSDGLPTLYTLDEAAAIARRTSKAMRQLRQHGRGPRFRKIDGRLLVSAEDLAAWLVGDVGEPSQVPAMTVTCELCGQTLDPRTFSCYQWISGWAKLRRAGGPNAVAHPNRAPRYACGPCVQAHTDHTAQGTLV